MRLLVAILSLACLATVGYCQPDLVQRGAAITVKVPSYVEAQKALYDLVAKNAGTTADQLRTSSESGRHNGWWRIRVPKENLDIFLSEVRQLGKVYGERRSLVDHSAAYSDLGHRAERLRQHEQRLGGILQMNRRLRGGDILYIQERIFRASVDEDMLTQQKQTFADVSKTSSVIVNFFEPTPVKEEPRGILGRTKAAFLEALRSLAFSVLNFIGTLLYLIVYALIAWIIWRIFRKPIRAAYERSRVWLDPTRPNSPPPPAAS